MKKLMMLGGAMTQLVAIQKAKEMGYYVILCDGSLDAPGKQFADEFYHISTSNEKAILQIAKRLQIDGIVCYASDAGACSVAYVANQLGLPGHPYDSIKILTNKSLFRQFQKKHHFHTPKAFSCQTLEEAKAALAQLTMPIMIKPVDSSGSRGVAKITNKGQLEYRVLQALAYSPSESFILEEYIENVGPHIGGDGFSIDGKLVFHCFSNEYFLANGINPFVPIITTWPFTMHHRIAQKVHDEIQRMLQLLNMKSGSYNFDIRIDADENVYIIELAPRNGGDFNPEAIHFATGVDLIAYTLRAAVGEHCDELQMVQPTGYWATYVINSSQKGVFKGLTINREFKEKHIVRKELYVKKDEAVSALSGSHEKLGLLILKFPSKVEMEKKLTNIEKHISIKVEQFVLSLPLSVLLLHEKIAMML